MVRHGRASAGWDTAVDPDLDEIGKHQAERVAEELHTLTNKPLTIISSPLARCQQTARCWCSTSACEAENESASKTTACARFCTTCSIGLTSSDTR